MSRSLPFQFVTAVYLLEPWEKRIVNSVMAGIFVFTVYAGYTYVPQYAYSFAKLVTGTSSDGDEKVASKI